MRIGVNASFMVARYSGIATFTETLVECLRGDHAVVVYSADPRFDDLQGVVVRRSPASLQIGSGGASSLKRLLWMQTTLSKWLVADDVDLFFSPSVEALLRPPVPQTIVVHDLLPLFYREENPRQYYYYKYILPMVLRASECVISVSEHTRQDLIRLYGVNPERVVVSAAGLREESGEEAEAVREAEKTPYFLFVGTYSPRKNLDTVLRAFAEVAESVPERLIVVAYPDRWESSIRQLALNLNVETRVTFRFAVPNGTLAALYRNATALLLLSEYEGFGLPPIEAMAVGTPAVVSDSTSLAEVTGSGAIQVRCRDVKGVAQAMRDLSANQNYRRSIGEAGKRVAAKYSRHATIARLNAVLQSTLQQPVASV